MLEPLDRLAHWRERIFSTLLSIALVLGALTALPSMLILGRQDQWAMVAVDVVALVWVTGVWHFKRVAYTIRVLNFLAILFVIAVGLMVTIGAVSQLYLFSAPVLAAILLGTRPALWTLGLSGAALFLLGYTGYSQLQLAGLPRDGLASTLIFTLNYLFIASIITLSCSILLQRLARSLGELHRSADALRQRKDELDVLNAELRLTAAAVARLNDILVIAEVVDRPGAGQRVIFVNDAFERRTGYRRDQVLGSSLDKLVGGQTDTAQAERIARAIDSFMPVTAQLQHHTRSGEPYWVEVELVPFADEGGNNTHWVAIGRDITDRKRSERDIHRLAFYDVLTGLPNRRLLMERIDRVLENAQEAARFGALMFIDLDRFKYINDARGHATGDALLRSAAGRVSELVGDGGMVARIGGDEFVVLLAHAGTDRTAATGASFAMAESIRQALANGFEIHGQPYTSSASIGITLLPKPGQTADDLLREADIAMYRAKSGGRNRIAFFEATMQAEVEQRLSLERDLAAALDKGELAMHLQLQVDRDGAPAGAEMLMRWRRADGTMVPPDQFIPVAEESGLILRLGQWALREACLSVLQLAQAGHPMPLSVNVSPSQFRQADFVDQVRATLAETGAPATQLIFEVTEGLLIDSQDDTIDRMHELAMLGIRLSIDDFGTGYSSLAYLMRMPLYELKIDKSFIRDAPGDPNGTAIVQSILAMAGHLGLRVIAEGVETREQAAFLAAHGTAGMQGYLFARPVPLAELIALLAGDPGRPLSDPRATLAA
jgi:diguanylate cyclase (GGDEF)-like protein/PAS domain S-box-containing protein